MSRRISDYLFDAVCCISIIGIWPRFIEPKRLGTTHITLPVPRLPAEIQGLKILQISDLHINSRLSDRFLQKIVEKGQRLKPDLIVLTGDILCDGALNHPNRLLNFLNQFHAPYGCFAILGNHDYARACAVNSEGDYDVRENQKPNHFIQGLKRILSTPMITKVVTEQAKSTPPHRELIALLAKTPFKLLHNETMTISVNGARLNVTGLGEHMLGRCCPEEAFERYDRKFPGIILAHNPDSLPHIANYPGEVVLSGHTHGGQVYLPWIWKKLTIIEDLSRRYGLQHFNDKIAFISRGIGGLLPFRLFCPPELVLVTLR